MPSRTLIWLALALPLLMIGLAIARAELFLRRAQELSLPIQGYDPRDLLHGHYIQFRLALEPAPDDAACSAETCCLCLTRVPGQMAAHSMRLPCSEVRSACAGSLPLSAAQRSWRFYVPEERAQEIERALRDAHAVGRAFAVLAIEPRGEARVRELVLSGRHYGSAVAAPARP